MGWEYNSHIVCMCIIMRWSRNRSASWAERFRTSSLLCTYKLCDYYTPIPILSPFLFTQSLYVAILNLQDFSFTCTYYCVFLDNGDVYEHQTLHKFYPSYGCHGNIIMLPWQLSKMFVTGRKWPQTINQMCSPPLPPSSMVAMATLNSPL